MKMTSNFMLSKYFQYFLILMHGLFSYIVPYYDTVYSLYSINFVIVGVPN